jgi:ubiquinone/menaquinone biosynthesis C-methylase UbiE
MNFICPRCHGPLQKISDHEMHCAADDLSFQQVDGIWKFLLPERESHYARFIGDYEKIRSLEGRHSQDANYYRSLPFEDLSGRFSADWRIRAASYKMLERLITPRMTVIDLGAGNGWLSNRLAAHGCDAYAVDLLLNAEDGLGAWKHYKNTFTPVQAEFGRLPFADGSSSLLIFNASFHYSEDYQETLAEALRVIEPQGIVIIMDSPVYHHAGSGEQMVNERKTAFLSQYGFASDALQSKNYMTYQQMEQLGKHMGIQWKHLRPFYGLRWILRPWRSRVRGQREPAEFGLWVGSRR